ncbi:hypothetical protein TERTU_0139 [Teredinibacter turnerae T7901]|uniref:Uncharacterized protein n=1 Tax=Teredinibacter turnerae (strain ATCC 39867 / T7901) TaxID=377629 RepID=C5BLC5_TERTT|nr:hypothetical protein TERTU_0139 [Teredinibacter turnerae T7901]
MLKVDKWPMPDCDSRFALAGEFPGLKLTCARTIVVRRKRQCQRIMIEKTMILVGKARNRH